MAKAQRYQFIKMNHLRDNKVNDVTFEAGVITWK